MKWLPSRATTVCWLFLTLLLFSLHWLAFQFHIYGGAEPGRFGPLDGLRNHMQLGNYPGYGWAWLVYSALLAALLMAAARALRDFLRD